MHLLDNPIWNALTTRQEHFAEGDTVARKFPAEVTTLAGFAEPTPESFAALARLMAPGEVVGLFLMRPAPLPEGLSAIRELPLVQMWQESAPVSSAWASSDREHSMNSRGRQLEEHDSVGQEIRGEELHEKDVPEMVALAKLTEPGPFGTRTRELGSYIGVRPNGQLAAMTGERLKLPGYTEISAVCTHPDHTGHGYATRLVAEIAERIRARGERPFLHVREDNTRAADVYRRLGFVQRFVFHLMVVGKTK
jgi:ribosomal protein S18 acetylase RimI-like enzyme